LLGGALPLESFEVVCEDLFLDEGCAEDEAPIQVLDLIDLLEARALLAIGPPAEGVHVAVEGGEVAGPGEMCVFLTKEVGDLLDTESAHA
jgi:hypothetical protein